jgi:hypothetical protein
MPRHIEQKKKKELIKYVVPVISYDRECIQKLSFLQFAGIFRISFVIVPIYFPENFFTTITNKTKIVIYIARLRNPTLTNLEKKLAALRPRQDNLEVVKGFRSQGVHNILCATRKFVIIK